MKEQNEVKEKTHGDEKRGSFIMATLFILIGVILLLNNFEIIPWTVWNQMWKFWPVIVIIWGLELISGKGILAKLAVILLSLFLILFVFSFSLSKVNNDFNGFMKRLYPGWEILKQQIPDSGKGEFNFPFDQKGRKVFRCDPATGECKVIYK